jgi:hypothetical protein
MKNYSFDFNPKDCNKIYMEELMLLLDSIYPEKEIFKRINKKIISKLQIKCENEFNHVNQMSFFLITKNKLF